MKTLSLLTLCLLVPAAYAQERTATGPLQTEASWAALQNRIDATNGNVAALRIEVEAMKKCNNQKKIHAPQSADADADGCIPVQSHMHWNKVQSLSVAPPLPYGPTTVTIPASVSSIASACSSVGESPVQMDFCKVLGKTCYTAKAGTAAKQNCTGRGSGTGCNGTTTPAQAGNISVWQCM